MAGRIEAETVPLGKKELEEVVAGVTGVTGVAGDGIRDSGGSEHLRLRVTLRSA
jgi:hypothetical protein